MTIPTSNPVPSASPFDLLYNAEQLDKIVTSSALEYQDRLGVLRKTAAGALAAFAGGTTRGAWTTATAYAPRDVVSNLASGVTTWYMAVDAHTSGATFSGDLAAHWRVHQGATREELASTSDVGGGDALIGVKRTFTGSTPSTLHAWNENFTIDLVRDLGADPTGVVPADTAMSSAIAAIPSAGGVITFGLGGIFSFTAPIDCNDRFCVTLQGTGGLTGGSTRGTQLKFTGTGSASFLQMKSTTGCHVRDMQVMHSNTGFTGFLIDFTHSGAATDSALFSVKRCLIGSTGGTRNALGVNLDKCIEGSINFCSFAGLVSGVRGQDGAGGSYSNAIDVLKCQFVNTTNPPIEYMGQAWTINRNTFETRAGGVAGAISTNALALVEGLEFSGNWLGDVTSGSGAWCTLFGSGIVSKGNYFGGSASSIAFSLNSVTGAKINGNKFQTFGTVFSFDTATCSDVDTSDNAYASVTNIYGSKSNCREIYEIDFPYTPAWTQSTSNPTLGNGTLTGRYTRFGRRVDASFKLTIGSTTSLGTGNFRISIPYASNSGTEWSGACSILDSGTQYYVSIARSAAGQAYVQFYLTGGTLVTQAAPMSWATGDTLDCSISYYT